MVVFKTRMIAPGYLSNKYVLQYKSIRTFIYIVQYLSLNEEKHYYLIGTWTVYKTSSQSFSSKTIINLFLTYTNLNSNKSNTS